MTMTTTTNRTGVVKLWLLNIVANAAMLVAWYYWLLIPDARGWQVGTSALLAVVVVFSVLWLRAGTLAWFRVLEFRKEAGIWRAYRHSVRYVPALAFWVLAFVLVALASRELQAYVPQFAVWLHQKLDAGPTPRNLMKDLNWLLLLFVFFVMPAIWLPIGATVSSVGVLPEHLMRSRRVWKRPLYWLGFALFIVVGVYVPYRIVLWIPDLRTLRQQAWSMGARFLVAYLIGVSAFIAVVWITGVFTDFEDPIAP
jgi:hypothetical protein